MLQSIRAIRLFKRNLKISPSPKLKHPTVNEIDLKQSDIDFYRRNGYFVVENLLNKDQLEQWRTIIFNAVEDRSSNIHKFAQANQEDVSNIDFDYYDRVFLQRVNLWQTHSSVKELLLSSGHVIGRLASLLEDQDAIRIWHDQALIKRAFDNPTSWHIDVPYWSFTSLNAISVWIALDDATLENGCMYFMPGSHRIVEQAFHQSNKTFPQIKIGHNLSTIFDHYPQLKQSATVPVPLKAGSASFHSGHLVHAAGANMTPTRRAAMTIQMMPDRMVFNGQQNILTKEQISQLEVGKSMFDDDRVNPLLYRRK